MRVSLFIVNLSVRSQRGSDAIITIDQLTKKYTPHRKALDGISLHIAPGAFGLLGPNGAGKTTLMRILATLIAPTSGAAAVYGYNVTTQPQQVRALLGYLPQEYGLYPHLTAWEFLDYMAILSGLGRERRERIAQVLDEVGLSEFAHRRINSYSGGMKQRVAIAQALLHNPQALIIDEPTAGLDPAERIRFRNLLATFSRDRLVLLSTHIVADITATCTHLAVLERGQIRFHGTPAELTAQAQGRVWQATVPMRELPAFQQAYILTSTIANQDGNRATVRFLTQQDARAIPSDAEQLDPTLEDAYLLLTGHPGDNDVD